MKTNIAKLMRLNSFLLLLSGVIVLIFATLTCRAIPQTKPLTLEDLEYVHLGDTYYNDIAGEIGGGDWLSDAEFFTVAYEVEGEMQLVMVFEDSIHLSAVTLHRPDGTTVTIGNTHQTNKEQFSIFSSASSALGQ